MDVIYRRAQAAVRCSLSSVRLNTDLNIPAVLEMPFGHRGEGDDAKTRRLSLLAADQQTSDGALCSASGAWSAEQLSVMRRTKKGESRVNKV